MPIENLLNPKIDYVFKRIFGYIGNEEITKSLLSSILNTKIDNITLDCKPILEKDLYDDKIGILDIKAKLNDNTICDVEMQIADRKDIEKRLLFYWSKLYSQGITSGNTYSNLQKTIIVLFSDYNLDSLKNIEKCVSKWQLTESDYVKTILTDVLEIYIIELSKFEKYKHKLNNKDLNLWINFIENPEVIDMKNTNNKEVKQAKKVLEEISQDEYERYLAELREKHILDQKAIQDAGYDKGLKAGIAQGVSEGAKNKQIEIAKKMLKDNVPIENIISYTGLTKEEIENLI